jgi:hypothetical protein
MMESYHDLGLRKIHVIYPGNRRYSLDEIIEVLPITELAELRPDLSD